MSGYGAKHRQVRTINRHVFNFERILDDAQQTLTEEEFNDLLRFAEEHIKCELQRLGKILNGD